MPRFAYTALDRLGHKSQGAVQADTHAAAVQQVVADGLRPMDVREHEDTPGPAWRTAARTGRVSQGSVEAFTRELANLLGGGVSLSRALHLLSREAAQPAARREWARIHDDVVNGTSLADALAKRPRSFAPVYVAMVRAGETGGFLDMVLTQIADFRARERDLVGRVKAAMVYPAVLAVLAVLVLVFLLTYFIPRFSSIFAEFGSTLPWLTRAIVRASELVVQHGLIMLTVLAIVVLVVRRALVTESGRRVFERAVLRLPGVGRVVARFALVRFCHMLGTLLGAGVPLVAALRVAKEAIGNQILVDSVGRAIEQVQQGTSLARSLAGNPRLFPASVAEMVAVAEESARLDKELIRLARTYEQELDRQLRMLVALAEPALLFVMAVLVGTVVIGMLLPVFTLQELFR
jgi:type II secretory pathway component PulF